MENPESYPKPNTSEQLQNEVRSLGLVFGISGLEIKIESGKKWSCAKQKNGRLTINADPDQLKERHAITGEITNIEGDIDPKHILYATAHELGHAKDFLDPTAPDMGKLKKSDHFFWNVVDDTVINTRLRRVPMLDSVTNDIYDRILFPKDDLTHEPKHAQMMYGILVDTVTDNQELILDPEVQDVIDGLKNFEKDGQNLNILQILTSPYTNLKERRKIARKYIRPHYIKLLEEDRENGKGEGEDGDGDEFEETYDKYEDAMHGEGHDDDDSDDGDLGEQIAKHIKEIKADKKAADAAKNPQPNEDENKAEQVSKLAGSVRAEMNLNEADALAYANSLYENQYVIGQVADVLMKLAAPADVLKSPRFKRNSSTDGARLHPQKMAYVALQIATDQNQAIWQPISHEARRRDVEFGGLDVHIVCDVSGSMAGENGKCAADTGLCLIEGLQLARYRVSKQGGKLQQPDVRTQIIAFGSGTEVLCEANHVPTGEQKGKAYINLRNPESGSTLIDGSLQKIKQDALDNPNRDHIIIVISDAQFSDYAAALATAESMPQSVETTQLIIGSQSQNFLTPNHESLRSPQLLPIKLLNILYSRIQRYES